MINFSGGNTAAGKEVVSPGYPNGYPKNLDYNTSINFDHDKFAILRFIEFYVENDIRNNSSFSLTNTSCRSVIY